ncbi:hypothetical protein ACFHW2_31655 [Actinomadura sp. LOL_016]
MLGGYDAPPSMHIDELVEHWTVLDEERELIAGSEAPPGSASRSC